MALALALAPGEHEIISKSSIYSLEELEFYTVTVRPTMATPTFAAFSGAVKDKYNWNGSLSELNGQTLLIRVTKVDSTAAMDTYKAQMKNHSELVHEGILPVHAVCKTNVQRFLVSHAPEFNMTKKIAEKEFTCIHLLRLMKRLGEILEYLHGKDKLLNSLNINTILVDGDKPVIYDLSASTSTDRTLDANQTLDTDLLDSQAIEPHLVEGMVASDLKSDVFTLGLIMFQAFDKYENMTEDTSTITYVSNCLQNFAAASSLSEAFHGDFAYSAVDELRSKLLELACSCLAGQRGLDPRIRDGLNAIRQKYGIDIDFSMISSRPTVSGFIADVTVLEQKMEAQPSLHQVMMGL